MDKINAGQFPGILASAQYVIVDFSSPGCAPCKKVPPLIEEALKEIPGKNVSTYEVDIVENMEIAQQFFVLGVPTIIVFKEGKEIRRFNSLPRKDKLVEAIA